MNQQAVAASLPGRQAIDRPGPVPVYAVATIGFSDVERKVLGSIFALSARRNPRFVPFINGGPAIVPDLFLVDLNDPRAALAIPVIAQKYQGRTKMLLVGSAPAGLHYPCMPRPLLWTRTLKAMEDAMLGGAQVAPPVRKTERVLVVDDSLAVRRFMESRLAPFGFAVDYAESGEQAIGLCGEKRYTCVFLDVVLPGVDGYQVCKLIKAKKRSGKPPAVVMLTSKGSTFDKIRGALARCDAYLTKPVNEEKLLENIAKFLPVAKMSEVAA